MKIDAETAKKLRPWFPNLDMQSVTLVNAWPTNVLLKHVLRQGAMTIAPFVFYGKGSFNPDSDTSVALLAHELRHIEQYRSMGYLAFFRRYFLDKTRNGFAYSRSLPLEKEAYDLQVDVLKGLRGEP